MKVVTKVTFTKKFRKQLRKIPPFLQKKVSAWIFTVEIAGLRSANLSKGLHDEPLLGTRWGQRSIRLNNAYRLIYRTVENQVHIELIEVHKHDY